MKLTENFDSKEFACNDGTVVPRCYFSNMRELANNLQILHDSLGLPVRIRSGYRTVEYNKKVGGVDTSHHLTCSAADIWVLGLSPRILGLKIKNLIKEGKMKNGGLGIYPSFVHYDTKDFGARW